MTTNQTDTQRREVARMIGGLGHSIRALTLRALAGDETAIQQHERVLEMWLRQRGHLSDHHSDVK